MEEKPKDIRDYFDFIKRRKFHIFIPFLCIFAAVGIIAFLLPSIYRSTTTILIEEQQIPMDIVRSTVTGYVEERIQTIMQQIMSRTKLVEIVNRFNLYNNLRDRYTTEEIIDKMRDDIKFEPTSADVVSEKTGRPTTATIAFTVSYEGKDPAKVQNVANVLASLYLEENLRTREQRARTTTAFLQNELNSLKDTIVDLEKKIAAFKERHIGELPELMQLNLQTEQQIRREVEEVERQIRNLEDRKVYLEGQMATVKPDTPLVDETGRRILDAKERLRLLRIEYIALAARVSDKHPDITRIKKEISDLEKTIGDEGSLKEKQKESEYKRTELEKLQAKYSDKHPDVIKLKKEIDLLKKEVETLSKNAGLSKVNPENPENPAYINLATQIKATEIEIESLKGKRADLDKKWHQYLRRIEDTPRVEKDYVYLLRDYDNAKAKYRETMDKLMEARRAEELEEAQSSEKFTIIDPAQLPEKPYKPNRLAIILIGFILAMGSGIGYGSVTEYMDHSVRTANDLAKITGLPVLSTIPGIVTNSDKLKGRRRRLNISVISVVSLVVLLIIFHFFVINLDLLWLDILRKLSV
jgi:succinoglycan biosynthesis transport protein ExoP